MPTLAPADDRLAAADPGIPGLADVLAPADLVQSLGVDVADAEIRYLRYKPGISLVAGLLLQPLPDGDPLWRLDGAHISPHMSGDVVGWRDTLSAQFLTHLRTWCGGGEPGPAVDKGRGYVSS